MSWLKSSDGMESPPGTFELASRDHFERKVCGLVVRKHSVSIHVCTQVDNVCCLKEVECCRAVSGESVLKQDKNGIFLFRVKVETEKKE